MNKDSDRVNKDVDHEGLNAGSKVSGVLGTMAEWLFKHKEKSSDQIPEVVEKAAAELGQSLEEAVLSAFADDDDDDEDDI